MSPANPIGTSFIELHRVESTNNYAMGLLNNSRLPDGQETAQHGTAIFAHEQYAGKGQRGKQWTSEPGKNIALSIIIQPAGLGLSQSFLLSMAVAVATRKIFVEYAGDEIKIKWPNDIYWRDRKAGGILIENVLQGDEWKWAVCGIGLNVNQVQFGGLQKAVSLKQITGKDFVPVELAEYLCKTLNDHYNKLLQSPSVIVKEYKKHLYKLHEKVKLKKGNRIFEATIKDVMTSGELIVQHSMEERFSVGDVEWIIQ